MSKNKVKFHPRNKLKSANFLAKKRAEISSFSSQENELKTVDYLAQNNELKLEEFLTKNELKLADEAQLFRISLVLFDYQ